MSELMLDTLDSIDAAIDKALTEEGDFKRKVSEELKKFKHDKKCLEKAKKTLLKVIESRKND